MTNHRIKIVAAVLACLACASLVGACADTDNSSEKAAGEAASAQIAFATPEEAVQAFAAVVGTGDMDRANQIFGSDGVDLLTSGDEVADRAALERIKAGILEKVAFEDRADDEKVALFGEEGWPFPVPLVHDDDGWRFDVEAGWEEIENRRVGRNELLTLATFHEFVEAQREYAAVGRDGNPRAFAQKLFSTEGKHDGLYWPVTGGEPESPFGAEIAAAAAAGYTRSEDGPKPFHGYKYHLLTAQGPSAPGGARSYVDAKGLMTGGFALIAWPAKYGNSGVMTFIVNHQGLVYQRDLGEDTEAAAMAITAYDPDGKWDPARGE